MLWMYDFALPRVTGLMSGLIGVCCYQVIGDSEQDCFCVVARPEDSLKHLKQVTGFELILKLAWKSYSRGCLDQGWVFSVVVQC